MSRKSSLGGERRTQTICVCRKIDGRLQRPKTFDAEKHRCTRRFHHVCAEPTVTSEYGLVAVPSASLSDTALPVCTSISALASGMALCVDERPDCSASGDPTVFVARESTMTSLRQRPRRTCHKLRELRSQSFVSLVSFLQVLRD